MADAYARNPAVDDLRERNGPALIAAWTRKDGPPPTLFASGESRPTSRRATIPSRSCGCPGSSAAAARADATEWARLFDEYSKGVPDADVAMMYEPAANDPANSDYLARVSAWAMGRRA